MKRILTTLLLSAFCLADLFAQEALSARGGEASGSGGSVSYTLGQLIYSTESSQQGSLSHGVQQTYEINLISGTDNKVDISPYLSVYPNPASRHLTLDVELDQAKDHPLSYQLYDMNGRLLQQQAITSSKTSLQLETLNPAVYILKVKQGNKELKIFRIVKN